MTYEENKYAKFFEIDEGYYPEINESSIKDPKNKWQATFPHGDIVELLKLIERALSRTDKKSLWLEGSYGTGKSRIIWMLQNLLTCADKDFTAYFERYQNLKAEKNLREGLRTIRTGKIVAAFRYATGDITSTPKLIFAVFESLSAALKKAGCKFDGAKTLRGKIANWLEFDSANLELFRAKIQKPEYKNFFAGKTAEEIIERLKNPNAEVSRLVEEILKLGEREGILAFNINMQELTAWISEVISENNLQALILFWDEFSKFFSNNRNNLDEIQRLAELSNIAPFYLVIATHESAALAVTGDQTFRTFSDRFNHKNITMPDSIAFELIGHALKIKPAAKKDWQKLSAALKERTATPRKIVMNLPFIKIRNEKILTDILPIHPVSAILLKHLAAYFASNQRSIFNFIKNDNPKVKAFQDFINTKSPENGDLLTIDYLWNFFYGSGGQMNFRASIRAILDSYELHKKNLNSDEKIILKAILLLQAIYQESGGNVEIFSPTEKNLELAFGGVADFEGGRAVNIANDLIRKEILFKKPGKIPTFAVVTLAGDFHEIQENKKFIAENVKTADLIESVNLLKDIQENFTPAQKARFDFSAVTADNFTFRLNRLDSEFSACKLQVVISFARNEIEQTKIKNLISRALADSRYGKFIFVDASANLISEEIFNRWVEFSANEKYWRGKDNALADKMQNDAVSCLKEWRDSFTAGVFIYYPALKTENRAGFACQNIKQVSEKLSENVRKLFPYSVDAANIPGTAFQSTNLKKSAEAGILQQEFFLLKTNSIKIILDDAWQNSGKYWEIFPALNISRLKIELDSQIKSEIEKNIRVSFDEIFNFLAERGFMPLNVYAFLTGFLLKEYSAEPYRFSAGIDGNAGGAMNSSKLAEFISETFKQNLQPARNYRPKYLEILSPNQRKFMEFAAKIFDVEENISVEQCAQKFRLKLKNLGYPFWCYVDAAGENYKDFLRLLAEIANSKQAVSISALAERAGQFLASTPNAFSDLKIFLDAENGRKFFTAFIENFEGGMILNLAQKIGLENIIDICQRRITFGDRIWLHDKETAEDDLRKFIVDCKIVAESQKFSINEKSFSACVLAWKNFCGTNLKIPAEILGDCYPPLKNFFATLKEIVLREELSQSNRENFLRQLTENAAQINVAISAPLKVLQEKFSYQLGGLTENEVAEIYSKLAKNSFTETQGNFSNSLNEMAQEIKSSRKKNKMLQLWREVAGKKLPHEWSKDNRTPILVLVPKNEVPTAQKVFDTIISDAPKESEIQFAIDYLAKKPPYFAAMNDARKIENAFKEKILSDYRGLLDDNDEIRNALTENFSDDAYQWYPNLAVNEFIKNFAKNKYRQSNAHAQAHARAAQLSNTNARKMLLELLDKNYEVGLKFLKLRR